MKGYHYMVMGILRKLRSWLIVVGILLLTISSIRAQDNPPQLKRNAVYFEMFGNGGLYSLNYDYRIKSVLSVRVGFTTWGFSFLGNGITFTGFPVMLNYLSGIKSSHFEAGLGCMPATVTYHGDGYNPFFVMEGQGTITRVIGTATIGYRLQPPKGGFVLRAGLTPFFTNQVKLFAGASVGVGF